MRSPAVLILTSLLLTSTALMNVAQAGPKGASGGGGPGGGGKGAHAAPAPRAAAPAHQPRAAAPAPPSAAPRVAAPHGPGPRPRMAAPHAAAPRIAPSAARQPQRARVAPPHASPQARVAAPGRASRHSAAGQSATPGMGGALSKPNRAPLASSTSRGMERAGKHDNQRTEGQSARNPSTGHGAGPGRVGPIAQPPNVANGNRDRNANRALTGGTQLHGVANRTPILRNAAFASVPSRNPQARSLAQSTFRGGFAQSGFVGHRSGGHHRSFSGPTHTTILLITRSRPMPTTPSGLMRMTISTKGSTEIMLLDITRMKTPMRTRARRHQVRLMRMRLERRGSVEEGRLRRRGPH
jgi:hypothetical protein